MKFVIQRVKHAEVTVDGNTIGRIGKGYMVLIGVSNCDDEAIADKMLDKMIKLRIFEDENGKTNKSIKDVGGSLLLVSQFTLLASCKDGNRPSFIGAGDPKEAKRLYEYMISRAKEQGIEVGQGQFGADMQVELINDGPFTIVLDENNI